MVTLKFDVVDYGYSKLDFNTIIYVYVPLVCS